MKRLILCLLMLMAIASVSAVSYSSDGAETIKTEVYEDYSVEYSAEMNVDYAYELILTGDGLLQASINWVERREYLLQEDNNMSNKLIKDSKVRLNILRIFRFSDFIRNCISYYS